MHPKCRAQLNAARVAAGGKDLSDAQAQAIDDRMNSTMRRLARQDPNWQSYPADQRVLLAAQQAAADIKAEVQRKVDNAHRQVMKTAELETRLTDYTARQGGTRGKSLVEDYQRTAAYIEGTKRDSTRQLMDLIDAAGSHQDASAGRSALMFLFHAQNPAMSRDLALEVFAQGKANTGNAIAKKGAEAWLKVIEPMRQRFNTGGGDIGKLDYGYLPQAHDAVRVRLAGQDRWANKVLPLVDRSRYLREDGSRMSDTEMLDMLRGAWDTIQSDGANKTPPGQVQGSGARANRGSESREIHFKDGDAYLAYLSEFGQGSMYDAMIGHIGGLSRDIALVERYGPNPEAQMRLQFDLAKRADGERSTVAGQLKDNLMGPEAQWNVLSGASGRAQYARVAQVAQDIRNIETFGKLQGAVLTSITDLPAYFVTAGYNNLSYWQALTNIGRAMTKGNKEFMNAHGMMAESMISDLNRWAGENLQQNWSGRIAAATMRLSFMNFWTDTLRRAFSMTMMQGTARLLKTDWPNLHQYDRWRMEQKGLTEADWNVIRGAQQVNHRGFDYVTPDAIYATGHADAPQVVSKYLGVIADEAEIAVINPDLTTRAIASGGGAQKGTLGGEFARSVTQFKSFPIAMITRHWRRMLETPGGMEGAPVAANKLAYSAAMMVSLTALGGISYQIKQLRDGKDPVDMTGKGGTDLVALGKFWTKAIAQGGGLGFVGDMLLNDTTDDRGPMDTFGKMLMGPTYSSAADLFELTKGNIDELAAGKDTHAGAEAVRFARGHLPLLNLWYAKAALDHAGLFALQENLSPGYLSRIQNKARRDWHQDYWWNPRDAAPERSPSFEALAGR